MPVQHTRRCCLLSGIPSMSRLSPRPVVLHVDRCPRSPRRAGSARAEEPPAAAPKLADYFGFLPLEIYKLDARISNLLVRDLDGDKIDDIVVVNNARSRIDLLLSTKKAGRRDGDAARSARRPTSSSRPADAAGEHAGQQGGRQPRGRRLQRRRQARPGLSTARRPRS